MKLITVLTMRSASERLPNKAIRHVNKKPLVYWLAQRLKQLPGQLVLATTDDASDNELSRLAKQAGLRVWRDSADPADVVGRIQRVVTAWYNDAEFVFRALGDCPFLETGFVTRAVQVMQERKADHFIWFLPPDVWTVYGSREFPYSRRAWHAIQKYARARLGEREHVDLYFNRNRDDFRIAYHEPPPLDYFRPRYRLEIDYESDLELLRKIAAGPGMLACLPEVVRYLDDNPSVARLNAGEVEKTGLTVSYDRETLREWQRVMRNQPVIGWNNDVWTSPNQITNQARQVFCNSGQCFIGWGLRGRLFMLDGSTIDRGRAACRCGAGRMWEAKR